MPGAEITDLPHHRSRWRIRTYIVVLAAVVLGAQLLGTVYQRRITQQDARAEAVREAEYVARLAATTIDWAVRTAQADLLQRATTRDLPDACTRPGFEIVFDPEGTFTAGHIDVIDASGTTVCTSATNTTSNPLGEQAPWAAAVLAGPTIVGPVSDSATGAQAVVIGTPLPGGAGAVVEILDLRAFGSSLGAGIGAGRYELVVVSGDGAQVVSRSVDAQRWAGSNLDATPFGRGTGAERTGLDGTRRIYGTAQVATTGWVVYAGAERTAALGIADRAATRTLEINLGLLVLVLVASMVVFRRIAQPIADLSGRVRAAITSGSFERPERPSTPEVEGLASDFAALLSQRETELGRVRRLAATNAAILGAALDSVITIDRDGRIVEFNPAAEETFGFSRDEVIGQPMVDIVVPGRLRDRHLAGLAHYRATGEGAILNRRVELQAVRSDGTEFPVELAVTLVDIPGSPLFTGYIRDLTAQVRAREELAASELRLQVILDNSPALVHMKDLDGRYMFINRQGERAMGLSREQVLGRTDAELFPAELARQYRADDLEALSRVAPLPTERSGNGPHGARTYLSAKFALIDAEGVAYGTAGISTDITERKRAEAERQFLQERLDQSQRLESLGQLAGGVAHDFNNLLAVILIHAKFVADATTGQVRDDVEQISIAAERAAGLTRQLLVFGRRETVHPQPIDLAELVHGVRDVVARGVGPQVDLVVEAEPGLPRVLADRGQIEQVLLNLAINARDAMPAGGTVTVRVVLADEPASGVCLTVTDTGSGMVPEVIARACEPFFTTKPPGEGTGLGLATVYGIVTEAGGTVDISSVVGAGTTVRIVLPLAEASAPAAAEPLVDEPARGNGETVLVVDDEPALLAVTVRMLEDHGYDVISAGSAAEALTRAEGEQVHLLLTDFVMPKMSGSQLAERMCSERHGMAVLLMSGYSYGLTNHGPLDAQGRHLLRKPFTERELLTMVAEVLVRSGGSSSDVNG